MTLHVNAKYHGVSSTATDLGSIVPSPDASKSRTLLVPCFAVLPNVCNFGWHALLRMVLTSAAVGMGSGKTVLLIAHLTRNKGQNSAPQAFKPDRYTLLQHHSLYMQSF